MKASFTCRGKPAGVYNKKEAQSLGKPDIEGHKKRGGCGHNLDKLFAAVPADGKEHERECPKCGNVFPIKKYPDVEEE